MKELLEAYLRDPKACNDLIRTICILILGLSVLYVIYKIAQSEPDLWDDRKDQIKRAKNKAYTVRLRRNIQRWEKKRRNRRS